MSASISTTQTNNELNESYFKFNLNPRMGSFWHDEKKLRRAVEIYGSVLPRKRALELISEETGVSLRTAKNFGSKILNSNEFDEYIKELHSRPNGKETYCYFNHLSNNKRNYDHRPLNRDDLSNPSNSVGNQNYSTNEYIQENNFFEEDEQDDEYENYFNEPAPMNQHRESTNSNTDMIESNEELMTSMNQNKVQSENSNCIKRELLKTSKISQNSKIFPDSLKNEYELSHQFADLNAKIDYLITNVKQINSNSINSFNKINRRNQFGSGISTDLNRFNPEKGNSDSEEEKNVFLSPGYFKTLMKCKKCTCQFSLSVFPKRAIKCGHSICSLCYSSLSGDESNESLVNCPICETSSLWTKNTDLISILEEVQKNNTTLLMAEINQINSSKLNENYSYNFRCLLKIAMEDFDKISMSSQSLMYSIIKRKFNKECQINNNPKRVRLN